MSIRWKNRISLLAAVIFGIFLTACIVEAKEVKARERQTQESLAKEVFRFHVLANSDSQEDQDLKMQVKAAVLDYMKQEIPDSKTAEETKTWAKTHLKDIEQVAQNMISQKGYSYPVTAEVTNCRFPEKSYGDVTFPAGMYDALRIKIGSAKGQNWWCVLYPNLCFMDSVRAVVPEEGKEHLKNVLTDEEYNEITEVKIKWFYLQICEGVCRITEVIDR